MFNILIIEDDRALSDGIVLSLKDDKYLLLQAHNIAAARELLKNNSISLIILDINLPDGNGLDFLREIREKYMVSIIILTANDLETDIVTGLELGADDYITKPFSLMVLRARVKLQLRKLETAVSSVIQIDDYNFNFNAMEFSKNGNIIELSKTEQKLLKILIENKGHTLSRSALVDWIWTDGAEYVDENALSVTIKRLRDKLEENPSSSQYIKTVYGVGYTWAVK
ncbi:response regulator transcription factor [Anaerocolumna aminovalerica]|uniref:Stage 0 sporulation protein A homolog n=1 Tax=Anaerocolumna aminovalerica TaxID=1527 RepID=A0A1I5HQS7_9FIRM|nr:response regulator transcription factor [Anaerocolumna aminovalerica]MBU5333521.1 response regulator transcription factor [Anaerocolumna aminovalerica]MDU6264974.1 response regulator transcription factor [Anaerocolumna aminovalerica]SFO50685.1 DNA-binding response regulator, OmpR family, contains REC and winged-helix (wHTH) domain [Anaerocolumna aminovalerica]